MVPVTISRRALLGLGFVCILTAALYGPWLSHEFIWDDYVQISENPAVTQGVSLRRYFFDRDTTSTRSDYNTRIWRPLRNLSMRGLWRLSDASPKQRTTFFHGANLVLYLLSALLVFALCKSFTGEDLGPFIATTMWLLIPVHAEDVLYASAFGDLLSCFFQLGGLIYAIDTMRSGRRVWLSPFMFLLAVLVKEMAITQVLLVPLYIVSEHRGELRDAIERRRAAILVLAHGAIAFVYLAMRTHLLGRVGQEPVTASATLTNLTQVGWLLLRYVQAALEPLGHAPDYGLDAPPWTWSVLGWIGVVVLLALATRKSARGARFGAWLFVIALLPVLRLVPMWTLMADRFVLVPSVGLALVVAALVSMQPARRAPLIVGLASVCGLAWAAGLTIEARHFRSDEALWSYGVDEVPKAALSQHNLGLTLFKRGDSAGSLEHLIEAVRLGRVQERLFFHIAIAYDMEGKPDKAMRALDKALEVDPKFGNAMLMKAQLYRRAGEFAASQMWIDQAAENIANITAVLSERAALLAAEGDVPGALAVYRKAVADDTHDLVLWQHIGELELARGNAVDAESAYASCAAVDATQPPCKRLRSEIDRQKPTSAP